MKMTLENYKMVYHICLFFSVGGILITIVLFFVFDVKRIVSIKTGLSVKRGMRQYKKMGHGKRVSSKMRYVGKPDPGMSYDQTPFWGFTEKLEQPETETVLQDKPGFSHTSEYRYHGKKDFFEIIEYRIVMQAVPIRENCEV